VWVLHCVDCGIAEKGMAAVFRSKASRHRIRAIFYAEFDNTVGPKVFFQAPEGCIAAEDFDDVSDYIITRPDLCGKVLTVLHSSFQARDDDDDAAADALGSLHAVDSLSQHGGADMAATPIAVPGSIAADTAPTRGKRAGAKILNFPVGLRHEKYPRNTLLFSVGFVLDPDADTRPYEPVLKKLGMALYSMEIESEFLFKPDKKCRLGQLLPLILHGLNSRGECFVSVDSCDTIALKLFPVLPDPSAVRDNDVPVRIRDLDVLVGSGDDSGWDLCMRMILPHIDGRNYTRAIAELADVELALVKKALQHLLYYGCVIMVDIFQYSNIYATQPRVQLLLRSADLREACLRYIQQDERGVTIPCLVPGAPRARSLSAAASVSALAADSALATFDRIFRLYNAFGAGSRTCDVCIQGDTAGYFIDDRKFITFGVMHGLLRRIHKYPVPISSAVAAVLVPDASEGSPDAKSDTDSLPVLKAAEWSLLDGTRSLEEICCKLRCSQAKIEAEIEARSHFVYVLK
jgi:hypothetical protein